MDDGLASAKATQGNSGSPRAHLPAMEAFMVLAFARVGAS